MKRRVFSAAALLILCLLPGGCREVPFPPEGSSPPAVPSASALWPVEGPKSAMDWERWSNAEEILKGKVCMTAPPWLPGQAN